MTVIHRRVFYAKVGAAGELVQHLREGEKVLRRYGLEFKTRLLTDHLSGRSDRVVAEWEGESIGDVDAGMARALASPEAQAEMGPWLEKLNSPIHYSEAENWAVR